MRGGSEEVLDMITAAQHRRHTHESGQDGEDCQDNQGSNIELGDSWT
jgi:hypothetical protein